jgi:CubicO group peptidase (beta-lactamase class C family)
MNLLLRWLAPALVLLASDLSVGRTDDSRFVSVRELIRHKLEQDEAPSIAVAVARDGKILWEEGFGWADKEQKRAATENTPYRLGSVSKPITATAIMVARQRGLVDLDRPINDYLGQAKLRAAIGDVAGATVRRVVQHMSGLPEYSEGYYRDEPGEWPSLDLAIRRYGLLTRPPGEKFVYSNLGYAALGGFLKHVSGKSYDDFLNDEVFVPLGMTHSSAPGPHLSREHAVGYRPDGQREIDYTRNYAPAADVYASAHDLARFGLFHLKARLPNQQQILSDKNIDEMKNVTVPMGNAEYGFGWHIRHDSKGRRQVLHGGASAGADAQFTLVPEEKICVLVLANVTRQFPRAVTEAVTNTILATLLGGKPDDFPTLFPDPPPKTSGLPGKLEGKWAGTVHTHQADLDLTLWCEPNGDVRVQLDNQAKTAIRQAQLVGTAFSGKMDGDIGTDDARRRPYELEWNVTLRGDVINGTLYATTKNTRPLRLGYWVALHRAKPASPDARAEAYRRHGLDPATPLESRVKSAPDSVLKLFRDAGRPAPKAHPLTDAERTKLNFAMQSLPPLHRRILSERLRGVSFLDGMPNTALTSTVNSNEPFRLFDITVNAAILSQTVSDWLTNKERTCFDTSGSPLRVIVDAGTNVDALLYVLLHEATHIVDASEGLTPPASADGKRWAADSRPVTPFTEGIWTDLSLPSPPFRDPLRSRLRFYSGSGALPVDQAPQVYASLRRTPFVSLYGGRNSLDDLAEYVTVYHLAEVLKQPYRIIVRRDNEEIFTYEPMKSDLVRRRIGQMKHFYEGA